MLPAALLGTLVGAAVIGALLPDPLPLPETSCVDGATLGVLLGDVLGTLGHLTSLLLPSELIKVVQAPSGE